MWLSARSCISSLDYRRVSTGGFTTNFGDILRCILYMYDLMGINVWPIRNNYIIRPIPIMASFIHSIAYIKKQMNGAIRENT